jgi:hypothetical protein
VGFEGDKLTVISEFAVKTVLEKFKMAIEKGGHTPYDEAVSYRSRVYATLTTLNIRCTFLMLQRTVKQKNSTT